MRVGCMIKGKRKFETVDLKKCETSQGVLLLIESKLKSPISIKFFVSQLFFKKRI